MKHALLALVLFAVSLSTFADDPRPGRGHGRGHYRPAPGHNRPGPVIVIRPRPIPRPSRSCQVVMVDRFDRVVRRYWGHEPAGYGMCRSGLRDCNWDLNRMGAWGYRCATVRW